MTPDDNQTLGRLEGKLDSLSQETPMLLAKMQEFQNKVVWALMALIAALVGVKVVGTPPIAAGLLTLSFFSIVFLSGRLFHIRPQGWVALLVLLFSVQIGIVHRILRQLAVLSRETDWLIVGVGLGISIACIWYAWAIKSKTQDRLLPQ